MTRPTYLAGAVNDTPDIFRRTRACWMRIRRYLRELYDLPKSALSLKTRMVKAEQSRPSLCQEHKVKVRTVRHQGLLRIIKAQRKRLDHRMTSYNRALGARALRQRWARWARADFCGGGDHSYERRAAAKANRGRKPSGCSAERTGWEGERVNR